MSVDDPAADIILKIRALRPEGIFGAFDEIWRLVNDLLAAVPQGAETALLAALSGSAGDDVRSLVLGMESLASRRGCLGETGIAAMTEIAWSTASPLIREDACAALHQIQPYNVDATTRTRLRQFFQTLPARFDSLPERTICLCRRADETHAVFERAVAATKRGRIVLGETLVQELLDPVTLNGEAFGTMGYTDKDPERFRLAILFTLARPQIATRLAGSFTPVMRMSEQLIGPTSHQAVVETLWRRSTWPKFELLGAVYKFRVF